MQNPSRRHHYIPVFLTKAWADQSNKVIRYAKYKGIERRTVSPKAVFYKDDLYRLPLDLGSDAQRLEDEFFKHLDCRASNIHRVLMQGAVPALSDRQRLDWAIFVLSLILRSPENIESQKRIMSGYWSETVARISVEYEALKGKNDPESFEEFQKGLHPLSSDQYGMEILPGLILNEKILYPLSKLNWSVIDTSSSQFELLISDDPIAIPGGLLNDGGMLALPISPSKVFVAAPNRGTIGQICRLAPNQLARSLNSWIVEGAREYVVARSNCQDRFILNRFGRNIRPPIVSRMPNEKIGEVGSHVVQQIRQKN